ncbi:MAG: hypothetical protein N2259_00305 [Patescibacteria group bacterium]|nr:hypothetical protein [Patescibacteria group bacterium]
MNKRKILLAILIIILGVISRIFLNRIINLPNFEAITSLSLLTGSFLGGLYTAIIPLLIIFFSDLYFGNVSVYLFTWSAFIFIGFFGLLFQRNSKYYFFKITGGGIISVLFFYLWTNFGWWLTFNMYPMNFQGLIQCYLVGLPFLKNQLFSVIIFTPLFSLIFSLVFDRVFSEKKNFVKFKL